jgi:hypothetical protein
MAFFQICGLKRALTAIAERLNMELMIAYQSQSYTLTINFSVGDIMVAPKDISMEECIRAISMQVTLDTSIIRVSFRYSPSKSIINWKTARPCYYTSDTSALRNLHSAISRSTDSASLLIYQYSE